MRWAAFILVLLAFEARADERAAMEYIGAWFAALDRQQEARMIERKREACAREWGPFRWYCGYRLDRYIAAGGAYLECQGALGKRMGHNLTSDDVKRECGER